MGQVSSRVGEELVKAFVFVIVASLLLWADNPVGAFVFTFLAGVEYERLCSGPSLIKGI